MNDNKIHNLSLIIFPVFLVACALKSIFMPGVELPATAMVEPTAIPTRKSNATAMDEPPPVPFVVKTPMMVPMDDYVPLKNPPEYQTSGKAISDATQALARDAYFLSIYRLYQLDYGIADFYAEGNLSAQEVYEQKMQDFATKQGLQVFQSESLDGMQIVSFPVKNNGDGSWSMWWFATESGAFSARPDIPSTAGSTWTEIRVDGQIGGDWGEDGNFYVFQLSIYPKNN